MYMQSKWPLIVQQSFETLYTGMLAALPAIIFALLLSVVGFVLGNIVRSLTERLFKKLRVDDVLIAIRAHSSIEKAGYHMNSGRFVGTILKWFIIIFFIEVAFGVLGLPPATDLIRITVLTYLPRILVATIILFSAMVFAYVVERSIVTAASEQHIRGAKLVGRFLRILIMTLAALGTLVELHIATEVAEILFGGIVFATALTMGIAAGLGSKNAMTRYIDSLSEPEQ